MKMYCFRYYHWLISMMIITSSYRQTSYSRPLLSHRSINSYCLIHVSTPALATPLLSHWPIRMGHFCRLNAPWPMRGQDLSHLHIMQICPTLPHTKSTERLPHILLTCNVISCDWFVEFKYYVTKVDALFCFWHPVGGSARYGRLSPPKGCQMLKRVSNNQWGLKCWMKLRPYRVFDLNANLTPLLEIETLTGFWPLRDLTS